MAIIPVQIAVFMAWGQPDTVRGWFELFQSNRLAGLLATLPASPLHGLSASDARD